MSYDIWLERPACEHCDAPETAVGDWNYTSNCGPMWRAAGASLAGFHGQPASVCAPILRTAIAAMEADPAKFEALNPENGWGSYATLLPALRQLAELFEAHPTLAVRVSR